MEDIGKEFLKPKDIAAMFAVTEETVGNWRRQGIIPYYRIKNTIRFSRLDVLECLSKFRMNEIPGQNEFSQEGGEAGG